MLKRFANFESVITTYRSKVDAGEINPKKSEIGDEFLY